MSEEKSERKECSIQECPWCDTTGDIEKNRKIYWGTVIIILAVLAVLLILGILLR